ncbi:hypothetical protein RND81_08G058500 [Saponaria officinalis]|uniref:Uncharacterized protein n=1 Tax=Saponaria officinalis TaxID=3572 RepID=A0AAW1J4G6_SAPOF
MQKESRNSGASSSLSSTSPSFTTDSSETLADIAARVLHELNLSLNDLYDDDFYDFSHHQNDAFNGDDDDDPVDQRVRRGIGYDLEEEIQTWVTGLEEGGGVVFGETHLRRW